MGVYQGDSGVAEGAEVAGFIIVEVVFRHV
jgi:hypothetical protein